MKTKSSLWKSARLGLAVLAGLVIYAYGFQVTKVDLDEFRKESRQDSRIRTMRALASPDILEYEQEEFITALPVYIPCPSDLSIIPQPDTTGAYITMDPLCGDPGQIIQIEGYNLEPNTDGPISFIPSNDLNDTLALQRGRVEVDENGRFSFTMELPDRSSDDVQYIRVTTRRNIGLPHFSEQAINTWGKIIETVFLALLATTVGTALSIPISFMAARNLMKDVKSPLTSIALSLIGWPLGIALGMLVARLVGGFSGLVSSNLAGNIAGTVISPAITYGILRWAFNRPESDTQKTINKGVRYIAMLVSALFACMSLYQAGALAMVIGKPLGSALGSFAFLGNFVYQSGDILRTLAPLVIALVSGAVLGNMSGKIGQDANERLAPKNLRILNAILAGVGGALLFGLIGAGLNWLYEIKNPLATIYLPATVGLIAGVTLAVLTKPKQPLSIGLIVYTITRTILNALRSVEALIMAIVAVIWVGIGPFAGTLALALHTVAALAKLYSEQVESILPGPIEAVQATGANRLQTIVYAVIPQIIPPYISFTMYRWDINVRMSTIIGFAGGGGIGFLLQQNINLMNYRGASTQMVAIAIVVASMDYLSSYLREKYV